MSEWQRVLWREQPFPDNYVPPSFLADLRLNSNFRPFTYWSLVGASGTLIQHICSISILLSIFIKLYTNQLDPRLLVLIITSTFIVGFALCEALSEEEERTLRETRAKVIKSCILVFLTLIALSPVLRTLTAPTSSDSIWALSAFLLFLCLVLADFRGPSAVRKRNESLQHVLSMNAGLAASIVLCSRLSDNLSVFALVLFSLELFGLFPIFRNQLKITSSVISHSLTLVFIVIAVALQASISALATITICSVLVFAMFCAPGLMIWAQQHKNEIRGPWDVAVPIVR
ncbi:phosphatidylinositol N-acetylglucosaminyltransferase [Sistotremastrum niveocremeum HHB9708]|uniref:Phosphatidylinositol N-acetylglucosaminyltransferase n=1 Tax=Sistotremastrum niveocremeum HHB9708 TaxID=1314777 RepID=A0A164U6Z0_9AGAM|nr:phosphatidylinositol N-acetylglucosaminyltransferase [Sistotremastrum niveocremeum HHB9708]